MSSSSSSSSSSSCSSVTATATTFPVVKKSRKRELKKIEDEASREVTFSKRRKGLFGKASELSLLCGAEIAIVTYSPHGNPFAFGTGTTPTSADEILRRFAAAGVLPSSGDGALPRVGNSLPLLDETQKDLGRYWWDEDPVDDENDLENYIERVEKLREKVARRLDELRSSPIPATSTTEDTADHPDSKMAVVDYCCTEVAGVQLGFGELGSNGADDVQDFDCIGSNFQGMSPSIDDNGHPGPLMVMLSDACGDANMQEEVWQEHGVEECWSGAASVSGTPSLEEGTVPLASEWTDADVDEMLEWVELDTQATDQPEAWMFDRASEDIGAMLRDCEAPSLHFLQDDGILNLRCSVLGF